MRLGELSFGGDIRWLQGTSAQTIISDVEKYCYHWYFHDF